jgi:hypothetical protein
MSQDQIICSLHQFVESSPAEIKSGWKPLFGALRHKKLPNPEAIVLNNFLYHEMLEPLVVKSRFSTARCLANCSLIFKISLLNNNRKRRLTCTTEIVNQIWNVLLFGRSMKPQYPHLSTNLPGRYSIFKCWLL